MAKIYLRYNKTGEWKEFESFIDAAANYEGLTYEKIKQLYNCRKENEWENGVAILAGFTIVFNKELMTTIQNDEAK